jgi:hypothetical protein
MPRLVIQMFHCCLAPVAGPLSLKRWRIMRCSGPTPKSTNGLRYQRYFIFPKRESFSYSSTVSVVMSPKPRWSRSPAEAWWMACSRRHCANGVKVMTPVMKPTVSFAFDHGRKLPCEQSCMMMKVRVNSPTMSGIINGVVHGIGPVMSQRANQRATASRPTVTMTCRNERTASAPV